MTPVTLRLATPADSEFCFQLHEAAMGGYTTAIWGWDEQRQQDSHTRKFNLGLAPVRRARSSPGG